MLQQIILCINKIHSLAITWGNQAIEYHADIGIGLIADAQKKIDETNNALHEAQRECAQLAGKVAELQAQLDAIYERDPDGYILDGWSIKDGIESKEYMDQVHPNDDHIPVFIGSITKNKISTLHEIHRAYGAESVDKGVE
jgi:homoaconitase/3-isopropylmalate dehydratase large subunit